MKTDIAIFREEVRQALIRSTGLGAMHSIEDASDLSGIGAPVLYNMRRGVNLRMEEHFIALLELPGFTEEFFSARGYQCEHIGNEQGCPWKASEAVLEVSGHIGGYIADGRYDHRETATLADKLRNVVRKSVALIAAVRRGKIAEGARS